MPKAKTRDEGKAKPSLHGYLLLALNKVIRTIGSECDLTVGKSQYGIYLYESAGSINRYGPKQGPTIGRRAVCFFKTQVGSKDGKLFINELRLKIPDLGFHEGDDISIGIAADRPTQNSIINAQFFFFVINLPERNCWSVVGLLRMRDDMFLVDGIDIARPVFLEIAKVFMDSKRSIIEERRRQREFICSQLEGMCQKKVKVILERSRQKSSLNKVVGYKPSEHPVCEEGETQIGENHDGTEKEKSDFIHSPIDQEVLNGCDMSDSPFTPEKEKTFTTRYSSDYHFDCSSPMEGEDSSTGVFSLLVGGDYESSFQEVFYQ